MTPMRCRICDDYLTAVQEDGHGRPARSFDLWHTTEARAGHRPEPAAAALWVA